MRTVKAPEIRRQELIKIALSEFMKNGYARTSVRGILQQAGGKIGMFYHYFKSKDEIFEASLTYFNELFVQKIEGIIRDTSIPIMERINIIFTHLSIATAEYKSISEDTINPEIKIILLATSLNAMCPMIALLVREAVDTGVAKKLPIQDIDALSRFILFGISGVLHDNSADIEQKIATAKELLKNTLGLELHPKCWTV